MKVCSLHFRREDIRTSINGRKYVAEGGVPSRFAWSVPSPRKRKVPTERVSLNTSVPAKKRLSTCTSEASAETVDLGAVAAETVHIDSECHLEISSMDSGTSEMDHKKRIEEREVQLLQAQQELTSLRLENSELKRKLAESASQQEEISSRLFSLDRFTSDADISFYTGLPNYATFMAIYEFLNPGEDCENIRSRSSPDVPEEFYNSDSSDDEENLLAAKKGSRRKIRPVDEFFFVLCRLRRGFSERHLSNLYGVAQSTVSRMFIPWINFVYLKFGQVCIWPSKEVIQKTMPADFKEKFPSTRIIIDCTEVFCEMPSSLLLNSELFSSYKNHVTLVGTWTCWNFTQWGHHLCKPALYRQYIRSRNCGLLAQAFDVGDSVMADKGFQIQDILPLGVSLNIPPFLGGNSQMTAEDVVRTQQIASVRIHVERAINKIKNFRIWEGVVPLSLFSVVNQMWTVCAFLCNTQDPLISG